MNKKNRGGGREPRQAPALGTEMFERRFDQAVALAAVAALPGIVAGAVAVKGVAVAAKAVRNWRNYRPPRWRLLACPQPEEVRAQWQATRGRRDPLGALRFGALLLNVSQDVDCSPIYGSGKHIVARNPGLKGWLRENCHDITYVTAMSYRKLAEVTCRVIALPEFMPLEWVLPGTEALDATREFNPDRKVGMKLKRAEFLRQIKVCREKLGRLLEGAGSLNQLLAALDVATRGHRHRVVRKITEADPQAAVERSLGRHLRTALDALEALPPNKGVVRPAALLALLDELKRRLESHCA